MSEFKAQILGILIVVGVFGILAVGSRALVNTTWEQISSQVSAAVTKDYNSK